MTLVHAKQGLAGPGDHPDVRKIDRVDPPEQLPREVIETDSCRAVFRHARPAVSGRDQDAARNREFSFEAMAGLQQGAPNEVRRVLSGEWPINVVNRDVKGHSRAGL